MAHSIRSPSERKESGVTQTRYEIGREDLPLHCPLDSMGLWNLHPRVYLPIEETGRATCPYCGTEYLLKD